MGDSLPKLRPFQQDAPKLQHTIIASASSIMRNPLQTQADVVVSCRSWLAYGMPVENIHSFLNARATFPAILFEFRRITASVAARVTRAVGG